MGARSNRGRIARIEREKAKLEGRHAGILRRAIRLESEAAKIERAVMHTADPDELERILRQANPIRQRATLRRRDAAEIGR